MPRVLTLFLVVLALGGFFAWKYRAPLLARLNPPPSAAHPAEKPDVLYSWVDRDGVTHFSQESGRNATRIEYDGGRISPIEPPPAEVVLMPAEEGGEPRGSKLLHDMRHELQENQQRMQEQRLQANDL
ncbi:MAG TPA: DUF4124 domain-containing protein [Moraxellaceae bacterium]